MEINYSSRNTMVKMGQVVRRDNGARENKMGDHGGRDNGSVR